MAIIVGTDSYITVVEADAYWSDRDNSDWEAATTAAKEAALREATAYIDSHYSWVGSIEADSQILDWPRSSAYDDEDRLLSGVPQQVKDAQAELGLQALAGALVPALAQDDVRTKKEKVGSIEVEYFDNNKISRVFNFVDMLLKGLFEPSGNTVQLVRA